MATIQAIASFGQGTHQGLVTGPTANRVFNSSLGTLGTDIQLINAAAFLGAPFGLRISGANHWVRWDTNTLGTNKTSIVVASWFRVSTDPGGLKETHVFDLNNAGSDFASFDYDPSTDRLRAFINSANQSSSMTIAVNTAVFLEFRYNIAANPHTLDWRIDGIAQTQVTLAQAADTFTGFMLGDASSGQTGAFDYGHVVLSTTSADWPLGAHEVIMLSVDTADTVTLSGTTGNFQVFTGATPTMAAWNATTARDRIDEIPINVTSAQDGWAQITTASGDYVQMPMTTYTLAAGEVIVAGRMLACVYAADATSGFFGLRSWNGTTERTLYGAASTITGNNTASPPWVAAMLTIADIDTQSELNALAFRGGFSSDAAPDMGLHAIYCDIAIFTGNAVAEPATVAAVVALPAAHPNISAVPAVLAAVVSLPQATPVTPTGDATATPAVVAAVAAVPRPNVNVAAGPVTVATAVSLARPDVNVRSGPVVLAAVAALARPDVTVAASPAVAATVAALARPNVNVSAVPIGLASVVAVPTPTVLAGGNITALPAVLAALVAVPRPLVNVGAVPAVLAAVAALPRPLVGVAPVPASVAALAALARPSVAVAAGPSVWAALVVLARPNVAVAAGPGAVLVAVAVPAPVVQADQSVTALPAVVAVVVAVGQALAGVLVEVGPAWMSGVPDVATALVGTVAGASSLQGSDQRVGGLT